MGIESMRVDSIDAGSLSAGPQANESLGGESLGVDSIDAGLQVAGPQVAHPQANHSLGGESLGIDSMDTAPQVGGPQAKHSQSNEPQANHSNRAQPYASDSMDNKIKQILCISERRRDKEEAIARGMQTKFQSAFDKLADSVKRGQYSNATTVASRIGKLKQEHRSIARRYEIDTITGDDQKVKELVLTEKPKVKEAAETLYGAYVIETNRNDLEPEEIWKLYMTLTKVEDAFKALKSNLGMRPIYHQLASRTAAHLFISVVAYHLYGAIALSLSQAGDKRSVHSILAQVSTHSRLNVTMLDDNKRLHNLRISSTPNSTQKEIYSILGVVDTLARTKKVIAQL
ncbi:transposase DDE domain protein [Acidithrix ferrooxidans]|uniref:Transposase DDE domain protein n=1 Tax=Acidithrix ferrooxidans TaxID=1280514 RepID=A0A0D8HEP8_9ACTN|nr:transposase DDE domain protein [Acidithrix ferrooxidans]